MTFFIHNTYRLIASVTFDFTIWAFLTLKLVIFQLIYREYAITPNIFVFASNFEGLIKYIHQIFRERCELCIGGIALGTERRPTLFVKKCLP